MSDSGSRQIIGIETSCGASTAGGAVEAFDAFSTNAENISHRTVLIASAKNGKSVRFGPSHANHNQTMCAPAAAAPSPPTRACPFVKAATIQSHVKASVKAASLILSRYLARSSRDFAPAANSIHFVPLRH